LSTVLICSQKLFWAELTAVIHTANRSNNLFIM
jgi:hypothetical protein